MFQTAEQRMIIVHGTAEPTHSYLTIVFCLRNIFQSNRLLI